MSNRSSPRCIDNKRRVAALIAGILALLLALSRCDSDETAVVAPAPVTTATPGDVVATTPNAASAGVRRRGCLLTTDVDDHAVAEAVRVLEGANTVDIDERANS